MSLSRRLAFFTAVLVSGMTAPLPGDTVYLKNGAWIDGTVRARSDKTIEIDIGDIGKVEILAEDVHQIEKNNRTGADYKLPADRKKPELNLVTKDGKKIVVPQGERKPGEQPSEGSLPESGGKEKGSSGAGSAESKSKAGEKDEEDHPAKQEKQEKPIDPELKARIESLVQDLQRQKPQYRVRAERHLKAIGQPSLPSLLPLAKNDGELVRTTVFRLFYDFGDDSVIDACIEGLVDTNEYVRDYSNKTLQRVTHEDFGFQVAASPRRREAAYQKWKKWWEKEREELAQVEKLKS